MFLLNDAWTIVSFNQLWIVVQYSFVVMKARGDFHPYIFHERVIWFPFSYNFRNNKNIQFNKICGGFVLNITCYHSNLVKVAHKNEFHFRMNAFGFWTLFCTIYEHSNTAYTIFGIYQIFWIFEAMATMASNECLLKYHCLLGSLLIVNVFRPKILIHVNAQMLIQSRCPNGMQTINFKFYLIAT